MSTTSRSHVGLAIALALLLCASGHPGATQAGRSRAAIEGELAGVYEHARYFHRSSGAVPVAGWVAGATRPELVLLTTGGLVELELRGGAVSWRDQLTRPGNAIPHRDSKDAVLERIAACLEQHPSGSWDTALAWCSPNGGTPALLLFEEDLGQGTICCPGWAGALTVRSAGAATRVDWMDELALDLARAAPRLHAASPPGGDLLLGTRAVVTRAGSGPGQELALRLRGAWAALAPRLERPADADGHHSFAYSALRAHRDHVPALVELPSLDAVALARALAFSPAVGEGLSFTRQDPLLWMIQR